MIKTAIILAGGLGTRLRAVVPELPKAMAPVLAKPFIGYIMDYCTQQGVEKYIFALGYKHEVIEQYLHTQYEHCNLNFSIEQEPGGTGGAIRQACLMANDESVLVLNGDTLFKVSLEKLSSFHQASGAHCTLALKPMRDFDRYGAVEINSNGSVKSFMEKKFYHQGLINGGVYALNARLFLAEALPEKFSFEKDYLEAYYKTLAFYGFVQDEYFIDIGIPEDFERAQTEMLQNINTNA